MGIEVTKSNLSDHSQIEITTNFKNNRRKIYSEDTKYNGKTEFWKFNFYNEDISWNSINQEINEIHWQTLFKNKSTEACINLFLSCLLIICTKLIPKKKTIEVRAKFLEKERSC